MMKTLVVKHANSPTSYPIFIEQGLLKNLFWLPKHIQQIVIITDNKVKKLYAQNLLKSLQKTKKKVLLLSFPSGEKAKNYQMKHKLEQKILSKHFDRDAFILALGGGVVGDIAGFIAATYMRGISYIQIPTTLLAMVDSSIGGKTSINTSLGKNLIGAFWHPSSVIIDLHCLKTLPQKHLINGLIEALKIFIIYDKNSFQFFEKNIHDILNGEAASHQIIFSAIRLKSQIVTQDEREKHLRSILNFGHTIGHALETLSNYRLLHGIAVGYGILVESKISEILGMLSRADYFKISQLLMKLGIHPKKLKTFNLQKIIALTQLDKKAKEEKAKYVLLKKIGKIHHKSKQFAFDVPNKVIEHAFFAVSEMTNAGK